MPGELFLNQLQERLKIHIAVVILEKKYFVQVLNNI